MFKYIKFTKVKDEFTTHEFRGGDDVVKVNHFDTNAVSIESENEDDIDALIAQQEDVIDCTEITQDEFKALVRDSAQINRIRDVVKEKIAKKYQPADEIAMLKRADDDDKRVAYNDYVSECVKAGDELKAQVGY